jgi:phosphoribosyl 1,2-cyclic phosphodiesterase
MLFQSLSSGSSGNAHFLRGGGASILIDCGIGPRVLQKALRIHGAEIRQIDAVLITHEHDDHVRGLDAVRAAGRRFHATRGTATALGLDLECCSHVAFEQPIRIAELEITPLRTSHDAAEPCGYTITDGQARATVLTDLGEIDDGLLEITASSDLIVIEANHDVQMLRSGPYPAHLKRRVASSLGHLSNADCGRFLANALQQQRRSKTIWLAHLSATNNRPELAVRTVESALGSLPVRHRVVALPRREAGPVWRPTDEPFMEQISLFAG